MRSDLVERRQAVVGRLVGLRRDGHLTSELVRSAAVSLGVDSRSVWRWLAAGAYEPGKRAPWQMTPAATEAFYQAAGRPTSAWRLLRDNSGDILSLRTFYRAVERDLSPAERAYARHGEDGRRRFGRSGPTFRRAASKLAPANPRGRERPNPGGISTHRDVHDLVAVVLEQLMFGRARSIDRKALPANVQPELDALAADGILDARTGTYRASHVALYSCYQLSYAPAQSTDKRMARPADITWHSH